MTPASPCNEILIVDNDEFTTKAIELRLEQAGYRCRVAHTGAQAMSLFSPEHTALVITDLEMPNGSGVDLIHGVRAQADTPIVVITGYRHEHYQELDALHRIDVLEKPFDIKALLRVVRLDMRLPGTNAA